jgi:hypothetical protein
MPLIGRDRLDKAIKETVNILNKKLSVVYIKGLQAIVFATPVHFKDGGRLRNNWFLTVGQPSSKTRGGSTSGSSSLGELGKMPTNILDKKVYFTNNLPYANTIEYGGYPNPAELGTWTGNKYQKLSAGGYSRQAPNGMVRINIKKMEARIKKL